MKRDFSKIDKVYKEFLRYEVPNILDKTREQPLVQYRQLFQTILHRKYHLPLSHIAEWFTINGCKLIHASVDRAVKRTENTNYYQSDFIAEIYDDYLDDKRKEREAKLKKKKSKEYILSSNNRLLSLLRDIPLERESEIYELVSLRIKSWSWKNKDNCKTYDCSEHLNTF